MDTMTEKTPLPVSAFKAYDIRGRVPDQLNEVIANQIGRAMATFLKASRVVVGRDMRQSSEALSTALCEGLMALGCDVLDIGLCGTEEVYFATAQSGADGGVMVTASHNPRDYNGMKLVREGAKPISGDTGLNVIRDWLGEGTVIPDAATRGTWSTLDTTAAYAEHLLSYVSVPQLKPFKIVVNPGNGVAGKAIKLLQSKLPFEFVPVHFEPDGTFPNGIPNPLLVENRAATIDAVLEAKADFGVAWDGDYDRCFLFDENGRFVEGYYIVGLLAKALLAKTPGGKIIHDPRLVWNTEEAVTAAGGVTIQSKTGHAFIKERMRAEDAIYGGEMSAHHYFKDFAYCDSGMIPWLLIAQLLSETGGTLSSHVDESIARFPCSGEINRKVADAGQVIASVEARYGKEAAIDRTDGLSIAFDSWRFSLRSSNTEPVLRLNVESRGDEALMHAKTAELVALIGGEPL